MTTDYILTKFLIISLFISITLSVTGCDGLITKVIEYRKVYCDRTTDSLAKELALKAIVTKYPNYPTKGICTDIGLLRLENHQREQGDSVTKGE
ncbi:MAG: hypothetical protein KAH32_03020 [Chlamydiia bacterium]|nr:hypothetical protein [Chlamydiia bacterium]